MLGGPTGATVAPEVGPRPPSGHAGGMREKVEKVIEVELSDSAKQNLQVSVDAVKELLEACRGIDSSLS